MIEKVRALIAAPILLEDQASNAQKILSRPIRSGASRPSSRPAISTRPTRKRAIDLDKLGPRRSASRCR